MNDIVNHPSHYTNGDIECIDAMVAAFGVEFVMHYCICNAFKYLWRCEHKGSRAIDIQKAQWYLNKWEQLAESEMDVILAGEGANGRIISRSVAQDTSVQTFYPRMVGQAKCFGHVQCDAIIMDHAKIKAIPAITADHTDAQLIHEAAIGRIAGDQIMKLMTLGLTEQEAEEKILDGFLR